MLSTFSRPPPWVRAFPCLSFSMQRPINRYWKRITILPSSASSPPRCRSWMIPQAASAWSSSPMSTALYFWERCDMSIIRSLYKAPTWDSRWGKGIYTWFGGARLERLSWMGMRSSFDFGEPIGNRLRSRFFDHYTWRHVDILSGFRSIHPWCCRQYSSAADG